MASGGLQQGVQGALAPLQSLSSAMADGASSIREHKKAVAAVAAAATGSLAVAALLRSQRRHRRQHAEDGGQAEAQAHTITSLSQLQAYRVSLLATLCGGPAVHSVVITRQGLQLTNIPAAVCAMRQLKELDLRGNGITVLPAAVGRLTALTRLCLADNRITELPEQIGGLQALIDLDVSSNRLTTLPDSIGCLKALKYLNVMSNSLRELPASFGGLSSLYRAGLKGNQLVCLPPSIGQLGALVELYLTDNLLESLPPEIGSCTSLVKLQASFNRLKSLPGELGRLPKLEMVRVASCEIEEIGAGLRDAPNLAWMSLASNPICRELSPRKPPVVEERDLNMGRKLGDGASGEVFAGLWQGRRVAVKIFVKDRSPDGHSKDEMAVAFSVSEKHLVRVIAQLQHPLGLVMDYAEGKPIAEKPNLQSLLRCRWASDCTFQLGWLLQVAIGVASALEHMHYRGIAHGDVYGHNVMADEEGHAILCDYGASFPYHKGGPIPFEAHEVRAFGLMLADMVQRLDIDFKGMEKLLDVQRELLALVQQCISGPPVQRLTFGAVGRRLRAIQKHAAQLGVASFTPHSETASLASLTPRTSVTDALSPRSVS